jgi:SAM-dependent methyltransferase
MSDEPAGISERMRSDWNQRAREDPHYYVAFGGRDQDEESFLATAADVLRLLEGELRRLPPLANARGSETPGSPIPSRDLPLPSRDRQEAVPNYRRALEIGCGPGRLMKPLSRHFSEIHGVDVSDEMIRLARERLRDIPHAHAHATNGASLAQFADGSFDFVYSYAVFQHIPSRDVVLEYMNEISRVLKPGGIFRGQFNGLPHSGAPDTWSGVTFSGEDIRAFTREKGLQLLALEDVQTQYMWTTWRRRPPSPTVQSGAPRIKGITNAHSYEPVAPKRERHAAISIWIENLPDECDLNNLEVLVEGAPADPYFIGWPIAEGVRQLNAWLPEGMRTGLLPVELRLRGERFCGPGTVRVIPAGPLVPRIISISDGFNLLEKNASSSGILKIQVEEITSPDSLAIMIGDRPVDWIEIKCIDPRAPRHELNLRVPDGLAPGRHRLLIRLGRWQIPADIDVLPSN